MSKVVTKIDYCRHHVINPCRNIGQSCTHVYFVLPATRYWKHRHQLSWDRYHDRGHMPNFILLYLGMVSLQCNDTWRREKQNAAVAI